jgi:hypothetical protein
MEKTDTSFSSQESKMFFRCFATAGTFVGHFVSAFLSTKSGEGHNRLGALAIQRRFLSSSAKAVNPEEIPRH